MDYPCVKIEVKTEDLEIEEMSDAFDRMRENLPRLCHLVLLLNEWSALHEKNTEIRELAEQCERDGRLIF